MWQICLNYHQRMGILPLKKCVNRDKCSFATKQRMFGVFAIDEILRYRWTRFVSSRTLCHPGVKDSVVRISTVYRMIFYQLEYFCFGRRKFSVAHYFVCSLQQSHTSHGSRGTLMTPLTDERSASSWGILRPRGGNVQHCASTTPAPDEQRW